MQTRRTLGQYEQYPSNIDNMTVGKVPDDFGMAIAGNGDVLVSMKMPDGKTIYHHFAAPLSKLDYLLDRDLTGLTVNPLTVR